MDSDVEVPEERCGFVLEPEAMDEVVAYGFEAGSDVWYEYSDAVCCWREVWDGGDGDRCIWHAEADDKPADELVAARADGPERLDGAYVPAVELGDAIDFEECRLWAATFDGTELQEASFAGVEERVTQFPDADLRGAQFPDADLRGAQFPDADLQRAQFPDADLSFAQFPDADLSDADLSNANFSYSNLRGATVMGARLDDANFHGATVHTLDFAEVTVNGGTRFGRELYLETVAHRMDNPAEQYNRVAQAYHRLRTLFTDTGLVGRARTYYIAQRRARRKEAWASGDYGRAVASRLSWLVTGYGTSVRRIVLNMAIVLVVGAVAYARLTGGVKGLVAADAGLWGTFINGLYFSVITFTTVGYGELAPVSAPARAVASVEAFAGTVLMVLLGFVLANREV